MIMKMSVCFNAHIYKYCIHYQHCRQKKDSQKKLTREAKNDESAENAVTFEKVHNYDATEVDQMSLIGFTRYVKLGRNHIKLQPSSCVN